VDERGRWKREEGGREGRVEEKGGWKRAEGGRKGRVKMRGVLKRGESVFLQCMPAYFGGKEEQPRIEGWGQDAEDAQSQLLRE
jgi:hypothetical protein